MFGSTSLIKITLGLNSIYLLNISASISMSSTSSRSIHRPNVGTPDLEGRLQEGGALPGERENLRSFRQGVRFAGYDNTGEPVQPNLGRSESPVFGGPIHGRRWTPRYQYQPSTVEPSLYPTSMDRGWHAPMSYVAVDPFIPSVAQSLGNFAHANPTDQVLSAHPHMDQQPSTYIPPPPPSPLYQGKLYPIVPSTSRLLLAFLFDTLPRQVYLHLLLRLPSLYFSRVARIFEDAELSMPDIKKMAVINANQWSYSSGMVPNWNTPAIVSPHFSNLKASWEQFIDTLMKEWKTLNLVAVLLSSAILTTLQLDAAIADPITRTSGLLALISSLMSLLYGCLYTLRFNTMRRTHKAAEWAQGSGGTEIENPDMVERLGTTCHALNMAFVVDRLLIMQIISNTELVNLGSTNDPVLEVSPSAALGIRIAITAVFTLGIVYFVLIVNTFRRYGDVMDMAWRRRIFELATESANNAPFPIQLQPQASNLVPDAAAPPLRDHMLPGPFPYIPLQASRPAFVYPSRRPPPNYTTTPLQRGSDNPSFSENPSFARIPPYHVSMAAAPAFKTVKVVDLRFMAHIEHERPEVLGERDIQPDDWARFISDTSTAWDNQYRDLRVQGSGRLPPRQLVTAQFIAWWNVLFFSFRGAQAVLCEENALDDPNSPLYSIYLVDIRSSPEEYHGDPLQFKSGALAERFGSIPEGLQHIFDPVDQREETPRLGQMDMDPGAHAERNIHWSAPERAADSAGGLSSDSGLPVAGEYADLDSASSLSSGSNFADTYGTPANSHHNLPGPSFLTSAVPGVTLSRPVSSPYQADPDQAHRDG
ncbi:hypothetical protein D9615_009245 [Tricholomella constricta]|uniref:Uncharacterized protein n=1 Tax=Tricholomella constricta TaxID=117010 RepID=A0A8H5LWN9_9AGAR|nr:hypothetical protein D9615_009245 [Tricholomella constricta]